MSFEAATDATFSGRSVPRGISTALRASQQEADASYILLGSYLATLHSPLPGTVVELEVGNQIVVSKCSPHSS